MNTPLNRTLDPALLSWVESANDPVIDFPIQNLPFGRFRRDIDMDWRIGDQVLDLKRAKLIDSYDMNRLMNTGREVREALRVAVSQGLSVGSARKDEWCARSALVPQADVELSLPCHIGDYTDFYTGIHHATTVGKLFRPDNPLLPNYKWVPIGYHGRASSIRGSGHSFHRPRGQTMDVGASTPTFGPSQRLDYELELGALVSTPNAMGEAISMADAEEHLFGFTLFNDWSARDIQAWEYQPLGPFLSKNFATTVSPWIVTLEALQPFRVPFQRPEADPAPLPHLDSPANRLRGGIEIKLEVLLQTAAMRKAGSPAERLTCSNYRDVYWTVAQLIAHHTVNGCNLCSGDLLGTGTLSGPMPEQGGSLLELSQGGKQAPKLSSGEIRTYLEDGDTVILRGYCERPGLRRIGFGDCSGTVLPAMPIA